jgi:hypothetical protein
MKFRTAVLIVVLLSLSALAALPGPAASDEGMYPISELKKLDLRAKGLEIDPEDIFAPDRPSLIFAIVSVGATGSFVSADGLFVTNHHVAFGAVQAASTTQHDYLTNGFLARARAEEIQAKGMTARITESFRDVSKDVLSAVAPGLSLSDRTKAIEKRMKEIVAEAEKKNPGKRAEVSEMFIGKTYVLFIYTYLKDIRIVYVPPRSIGEFGGEIDNWMWPRHTGDFSFLRAYVAPDGSPADFGPKNVPFKPKRFLKVNPAGVKEGDFMFLLGYPGRTFRHYTASYLAFEENLRMPYVADWYGWQIGLMEKMGEKDPAVALALASRIKGLANTMKNYQGKLKGMKKIGIVEAKTAEEKGLQTFIENDAKRRAAYGDVLAGIDKVYADNRVRAEAEMVLEYLRSSVNLFNFAWTAVEASTELKKPDLERDAAYMDRNWAQTKQRLQLAQRNYHESTDKAIFRELLLRALRLKGTFRIKAVDDLFKGDASEKAVDAYIAKAYAASKLANDQILADLLKKTPDELRAAKDPFVDLAAALYPAFQDLKEMQKSRKGALDTLFARLSDVKEAYLGKAFIPDANSTLRLTYGRIKGYAPADAVYYKPFTTLAGVLEKTTGQPPFNTPSKIFDLTKAKDFGRFAHPDLKDVPVCMLYDADTTGGNSGSPVLNAKGELVGVNFDRTYDATINDYAWNENYSRSIAVDIRYVLWVTQKFGGANFLLEEMGIK